MTRAVVLSCSLGAMLLFASGAKAAAPDYMLVSCPNLNHGMM